MSELNIFCALVVLVVVFLTGILLYFVTVFLLKEINKRYIIKTIEINKDKAENNFCKYTIGRCIVEDNPFRDRLHLIIDCKESNNDYYYKYVYVQINDRGEMIPPTCIDTGTLYLSNNTKTEERHFKN